MLKKGRRKIAAVLRKIFMMNPLTQGLPFLTRDMLSFEQGAAFSLRVISQSDAAGPLIVRGLTREGVFTFQHIAAATDASTSSTFRIPDMPICISVIDSAGTFQQGNCFVSVQLVINGDVLYEFCSGLVYGNKAISYPQTKTGDLVPDGGRLRAITGTDPAAGVEITESVPGGRVWKVMALRFTLVNAAAAGSRRVHIAISADGVFILDAFSSIDQIISETKTYSCANFGATPDETDDNDILINIPGNLWLPPMSTIGTATVNLNGGDNFGAMDMLVMEYKTVN